MPGLILDVGAAMTCFHQAPATTTPAQTKVFVSGMAAGTALNIIKVAGCPFQIPLVPPPGTKPQPCVLVKWGMLATKVTVMGQPVLLQPGPGVGSGVCQSIEQIPQGAPTVSTLQMKVTAL